MSPHVATRGERRGELALPSRAVPARTASGEPAEGVANDPAAREREAALTGELLKAQAELEEHRPANITSLPHNMTIISVPSPGARPEPGVPRTE